LPAPNTFGVTAETVRSTYLPHSQPLSTTTVPTLASVTRQILQSAGYLQGLLDDRSVDTNSITDATSAAYLWCQSYIELRVAVRLIRTMSGLDPAVTQAWVDELDTMEKAVDTQGVGALGPGATQNDGGVEALGPFDHISVYGIDTGDETLISDVVPQLRRSDDL
jgi:hypothetical protein